MIYNLFQFSGENEILEIHLNELCNVVDFFVIGSCQYSHTGIYKGINPIPNELLEKFKNKIIFVEIPYVKNPDPWYNEKLGRQFLYEYIKNHLNKDDLLLVGDLDEITKASILEKEVQNITQPITFVGDYFYYCLDLWGRKSPDCFLIRSKWAEEKDLNWFRSHRTNFQYKNIFKHIENSSWHFSSVGSPQFIQNKLKYFAHAPECPEYVHDLDWIIQRIKNKQHLSKDGTFPNELKQIDINYDNHPKFLVDNKEKFKHLCYNFYI